MVSGVASLMNKVNHCPFDENDISLFEVSSLLQNILFQQDRAFNVPYHDYIMSWAALITYWGIGFITYTAYNSEFNGEITFL
jgi:hypothetical protein